jgi:hypothetical protein
MYPNQDAPKETQELTYGQKMVGLSFNPSGLDVVGQTKQYFADLIDKAHEIRMKSPVSQATFDLCATAISQLLIAQMVAVKLLTWKD